MEVGRANEVDFAKHLSYAAATSHMLIAEQVATEFCRARRCGCSSHWREQKKIGGKKRREREREQGEGELNAMTIEIRDVKPTSLSTEAYPRLPRSTPPMEKRLYSLLQPG